MWSLGNEASAGCAGQIGLVQTDASATFPVRDTGIGIASEQLPHIFERFYRATPGRALRGGASSGLGLSIVAWILQAHDGAVAVESRLGHGSCFTVTLPAASLPCPEAHR